MNFWYNKNAPPVFIAKRSKTILHPFTIGKYHGHTLNVYQGCQHRCGYCYATYEWSPEFYNKIYAKNNAPEILENEIRNWRSGDILPVMVSSATDAYQPAEMKFELTRKCVKILQKYDVPYYIFTKSTLIARDLDLHADYRDKCFIVWSITTADEKIRRILEPGTPPTASMFKVMEKFISKRIQCAVNIDPIIPLVTDSNENIDTIISLCKVAGIKNVFGAFLRLRYDIWDRLKMVFALLNMNLDFSINHYKKIYGFSEPLRHDNNLSMERSLESTFLNNIASKVLENGMINGFPELKENKFPYNTKFKNCDKRQPTLNNYLDS
ncbi:MAG: radical SAM protein [Candidatus Nitrosocosmicus sp.]